MNDIRCLVFGGRGFFNKDFLFKELYDIHQVFCINLIINGGATGADELSSYWAIKNNVEYVECHADWNKYGRSAGPIRNQEMLDNYKPNIVVGFHGGVGTRDMRRRVIKTSATFYDYTDKIPLDGLDPLMLGSKPRWKREKELTA